MNSIPTHCTFYRKTPTFDEATVPAGLLKAHQTRAGVWGRIVVLEGTLTYRILEPVTEEHTLTPELSGIVEPQVHHEVQATGKVRFFVEFHR